MTAPEVPAVAAPAVDVPVGSGRVPDPTGATVTSADVAGGLAAPQDAPATVGDGKEDVPSGYVPPVYA